MESTSWYPVARSDDVPPRHVFHAQLDGVELALWRADDGRINAWENRCPHRSVRFTLGVSTGATLHCQYHGWQYRSGDGRCTSIPASPEIRPPDTLCAHVFAAGDAHRYVWVNLQARPDTPVATLPFTPLQMPLRSLPIDAGIDAVQAALSRYADLDDDALPDSISASSVHGDLDLSWDTRTGERRRVRFSLQPAHASKTIVHPSSDDALIDGAPAARWHNQRLSALRRRIEAAAGASSAAPVPRYIRLQPIPGTPARTAGAAPIVCTVAARAQITDDIVSLRLAIPPERAVEFDAGAHIDVHTPSGAIRQYSLVNAPGERREFIIGVKKEPQSRGGSRSIHDMLQIGERVSVSEPRNNFALSDTHGALLIAGGIGITPIVAMAQALAAQARPFALHYFARSTAHVAFRERLDALTGVRLQLGLDAHLTRSAVGHIVAGLADDSDLYVCGPRPLIDCVRVWAKDLGIDPRRVHAELFAHDVDTSDDKAFRVRLRSSGAELEVPAGVSLAAALNARGYTIDTSCEQGVCGTCRIGVLDGLPEHRDVYLSEADKATGHCMMPCVSRSRSALLVLDL